MKTTLTTVLLASMLVGCGSFYQIPPKETQVEQTKVIDKSFEDVWSRAVDWFATHNVIIDKIEKSSGLITAKYQVIVGNKVMDPGEIQATGLYKNLSVAYHAAVNMLLRSESPEKTRVTVNLFDNFHATAYWGWLENKGPYTLDGKCVSTGELERSVFQFIENR